jgi:hypothetical protein
MIRVLKKLCKASGILLAAVLVLASQCILLYICLLQSCTAFANASKDYITNDITEYGNYVGVMEKFQDEYIHSFFPDAIYPEFIDPVYSFRSRPVDACGCEVYLEFTMENPTQFEELVRRSTAGMQKGTFYYDNAYQEYVLVDDEAGCVCDTISLSKNTLIGEDGNTYHRIDYASIAKVLVNPEEQRIIFVSIYVFDGGGTDTQLLNTYFSRFNIDPTEYRSSSKEGT